MSKWIRFFETGASPSGKTAVWAVMTMSGDEQIGEVRWFARWRKYAFYPKAHTVFEEDCLRDIAAFCELVTQRRKLQQKLATQV